ncbi:MAG TPA: hypothetical protein VLA16_08750 [Ideonella sp.]|nr:hypothetical protein [Ideonella sp.]
MAPPLLFRPEAVEAQSTTRLGGIRIARKLSSTAVALTALCFAAPLLAFGVWGSATRKAGVAEQPSVPALYEATSHLDFTNERAVTHLLGQVREAEGWPSILSAC